MIIIEYFHLFAINWNINPKNRLVGFIKCQILCYLMPNSACSVFLSNTNNWYTIIWFQVFLSNTSNFQISLFDP